MWKGLDKVSEYKFPHYLGISKNAKRFIELNGFEILAFVFNVTGNPCNFILL